MNVFMCHASRNSAFVIEVSKHLRRNLGDVFYYEDYQRADQQFNEQIQIELAACEVLVIVIDFDPLTKWQDMEVSIAQRAAVAPETRQRRYFIVRLPDQGGQYPGLPVPLNWAGGYPIINAPTRDPEGAYETAAQIVRAIPKPWYSPDDLPRNPHLFDYEKDIIDFYKYKLIIGGDLFEEAPEDQKQESKRKETREKLLDGCPSDWPDVVHWSVGGRRFPNEPSLQDIVGTIRPDGARVFTAALSSSHASGDHDGSAPFEYETRLSFREAGPREHLFFPRANENGVRVGVLVLGGIAPGINAVIDGITQRHWFYAERHNYKNQLTVWGLENGFFAFDAFFNSRRLLAARHDQYPGDPTRIETAHHVSEGGSILGTSRAVELFTPNARISRFLDIYQQLARANIDILYIIGGDGSMKAAHALFSIAQEEVSAKRASKPLSVVAIPKTMDNDVLWVWQTFGFLSAVEKAREIIEQLSTEVRSNPRLCIAQLFGSDSGFVVSHAVLASATGHCDVALIPEVPFSLVQLATHLKTQMCKRAQRVPYGLVVMAETAIPTDAVEFINGGGEERRKKLNLSEEETRAIHDFDAMRRQGKRIEGQTDDAIRTAGLKIVSRGLSELLPSEAIKSGDGFRPDWGLLRVFTNEPRHLLRAIPPSSSDIIIGHRLGTLAVDNAMAGYTDFMISQWLTEYVLVPLKLVVLGRKRIPKSGIFWKSVLAKTGQPSSLE